MSYGDYVVKNAVIKELRRAVEEDVRRSAAIRSLNTQSQPIYTGGVATSLRVNRGDENLEWKGVNIKNIKKDRREKIWKCIEQLPKLTKEMKEVDLPYLTDVFGKNLEFLFRLCKGCPEREVCPILELKKTKSFIKDIVRVSRKRRCPYYRIVDIMKEGNLNFSQAVNIMKINNEPLDVRTYYKITKN